MIVDNCKDTGNIYADSLRSAGYKVEYVSDEETAVAKICKDQPDLVLLDVLMPRVNGLHILDRVKDDCTNTKTKVVMLTNVSDMAIRDKAMRAGARDYILKSEVDISGLLKRVDRVLCK
jgi:PleD family two-component response regulator